MTYLENLFSLSGKTAIITGASRGIGAAIAGGFQKAGANVLGIARSQSPTTASSEPWRYQSCDISNYERFEAICRVTIDEFGSLDILVNAAGVTLSSGYGADELQRFEKTISLNLISTFQCIQTVTKFMGSRSSIINITSINSVQGFPGNPAYAASKGGLQSLTRAAALDLGDKGIRVNSLVPGYIRTDMTANSYADKDSHELRLKRMIVPRWGEASDLIGAAIFLGSDASSYVTGADLVVDGGWLAKGL